jgi:hypothetical protein
MAAFSVLQWGAMRNLFVTTLLAASLAAFGLSGCTVFGVKTPPTLKTTTSAEQYERLYWDAVKAKKWPQVPGFLAANLAYSAEGKLMTKDQVVPYLQSLNITDYTLTGLTVKPNGPDMTLTYTLQLSTGPGPVQTMNAISVWQQVAGGYILTVHTERPTTQN